MVSTKIKIGISAVAALAMIAHKLWPGWSIDVTDAFLIMILLLPWLAPLFKSVEFPGGFKITLSDLTESSDKFFGHQEYMESSSEHDAPGTGVVVKPAPASAGAQTVGPEVIISDTVVNENDPNLTLVSFRIEVDRRIKALASKFGISARIGLYQAIKELFKRGVFDRHESEGLEDLIRFGDLATHGKGVDAGSIVWVRRHGQRILRALDSRLAQD